MTIQTKWSTKSQGYVSISEVDTKLLLALNEFQTLKLAGNNARQNVLKAMIHDMCGNPKEDYAISTAAEITAHPGKYKPNIQALRNYLGDKADTFIPRGDNEMWIQNINLVEIREELIKRGEIES